MITLELTPPEAQMIHDALKAWATQPRSDSLGSAMLVAMMSSQEAKADGTCKRDMMAEMSKATTEADKRENQILMLRAKLMMAQNRASEHDVSESTQGQ
jgi:hypothetical protein